MAIFNNDAEALADFLQHRFDDEMEIPDNEGEESMEENEDREYWLNVLNDELRKNK